MQEYMRIVMPLANEENKTPTGRCLLESRAGAGKLMLWVQDMKPEVLYKVMLIFKQGEAYAGLPLCSLNVRRDGKAELKYSFNAEDIEGYGLSLEGCAAIAVTDSGGSAALCGYKGPSVPWRVGFKKLEKDRKEGLSEKFEKFENFREEVQNVLKSHTPMHPFPGCEAHWVRISLDEGLSLPQHVKELLGGPFTAEAYKQYSHLILGKAADGENYYIGVPALYDPADEVGFSEFRRGGEGETNHGDYGYWLVLVQ